MSFLNLFSVRTKSELVDYLVKVKNVTKTACATNGQINRSDSPVLNSMENLRKLWSKICRLSANLFHEKHTQQIKELYSSGDC